MRISVVIPCFNAAETIGQQLDALANQSFQPWEVIVADNGSTDSSKEIISQYQDRLPNLQVVDASGRKGASHARNVGAKLATGDYLAFCDADDVASVEWLEALATAFAQHDFLASRFDFKLLNGPEAINGCQYDGLQNFRIPFLPFSGGCGIGIKRSLHEAVNGFDESILYLEDADYCLRVQLLGEPLTFVPEAVVYIRYTSSKANPTPARKAAFDQGYNWGTGLVKVYGRYRSQGMHLHGILPRLGMSLIWVVRCFISRFSSDQSLWRLGWHLGSLKGFFDNRIIQLF